MLHTAMVALTWLIGLLGAGGAAAVVVAAIWLGPVVLSQIVSPLFARFLACVRCVVTVVFVLTTVVAYWLGHRQAANECRDAELFAALRNKQADADIANETAKEAQEALAESADRTATSEQKVKEYAEALKARPNAACILTDADFPDGVRKHPAAKRSIAPAGK